MLLATPCLASSSLLAKAIYREGVTPLTMLTLRFILASLIMWLFFWFSKKWQPYVWLSSRKQFWGCVAVGVANAMSQLLYAQALTLLDPGLTQMIFSANPAIIAVIMLFLGERLTGLKLTRLGLGLAGLYFLTLAGGSTGSVSLVAVGLALGCALVYAVHFVLYQKLLSNTNSRTNTLYILSTMAVLYSVVELFQHQLGGITSVSSLGWAEMLVMALVSTVVARLLMFEGLARIGGTQAALAGIAEPVIVLFSSVLLLGERLSVAQWFGAGLVIASIALAALVKPAVSSKPDN
jgi:drug/metabolite transporter (DMT)-like permease